MIAIIAIFGVTFAYNGITSLALNKSRPTIAVKYDTTATYNLKYADYVNYTLYTENQDSCTYYTTAYGKISTQSKWVLLKRDTLTMGGTKVKYKLVTLRNATTDYLYGYNEIRILLYTPALKHNADSLGAMKYYLQLSYRNSN